VLWRRLHGEGTLLRETERFRPWLLLPTLDDVAHLGSRLMPAAPTFAHHPDLNQARVPPGAITYRELSGSGHLRYLLSASDGRALEQAVLTGASRRTGKRLTRLRELGDDEVLWLPPEEQYLVASGRTYFRDLAFDDLHRLQFDLETTGLDPSRDRIFLVAVRDNRGLALVLDAAERGLSGAEGEADLIRRLVEAIRRADPDVIENHNLHGFDLPFLARRAAILDVPLALGRAGLPGLEQRPSARSYGAWAREQDDDDGEHGDTERRRTRLRFSIPGRECIDTLDAVRRYDFAARDLPGHGLKAVARHFGLAPAGREYVEGARVHATWLADPERVRRYALDDVTEADGLARLLGGAAFALARMAPRRYERLADAGPATGVLDPLLVRAYLRAGHALPARASGDGTQHTGAALYLFAAGLARRVVKADVSSLYPSLMRQYRIGPASDRLGALLALVDRLVEQRLAAKAAGRAAPARSAERHTHEALSAAMKILVNSAYGYLGAVGLTRFADVAAANEVTRRGRELLALICRELASRGATLIEADTDGVYFAVPDGWSEAEERALVAEVAALLPPLVHLEFEGRSAAMLSHQPKNYVLLGYDGATLLRGVAFRSVRSEPYGQEFLRRAVERLLVDDVAGVRAVYLETAHALRGLRLPTAQVSMRVRLTKSATRYLATRQARRELPYEALLASGRTSWPVGEVARVYHGRSGRPALLALGDEAGDEAEADDLPDPRDYDADYYVRILRTNYASRLARAFTPDDFATLFDDPAQPSLFAPPVETIRPVLVALDDPLGTNAEPPRDRSAEREQQA
jgi:DNA polymerase elongation subunit (family B)